MVSMPSIPDAPTAGYLVIWEFRVQPESRTAFEKACGPEADWCSFFVGVRTFSVRSCYVILIIQDDT
jgi:hypothetical protein